jgi:hypothetical protein
MAFNNVGEGGNFWVSSTAPDNHCNVSIWFTDFQVDMGAVWIMATPDMNRNNPNPVGGYNGVATLEMTGFYKQATSYADTGIIEYYFVYQADVKNPGSMDSWFWLDGGGNT